MAEDDKRLEVSLLILRVTLFGVMAMWSLDKIVSSDHAAAIFANFYGMEGIGSGLLLTIGLLQLLLEVAFLLGLWRFWTYGYVMIAHALSTAASGKQYLEPFENLLFFAAIPMLGAAVALFLLRDRDRLLSLGHRPSAAGADAGGDGRISPEAANDRAGGGGGHP